MQPMNLRVICAAALLAAPCASVAAEPDPWEATNRKVFAFNDRVDTLVLRPLAQGYQAAVPSLGRSAVGNLFSTLSEIPSFVNSVLQGNPDKAATGLGRFVFNATFGLYGLIDVSTAFGLQQQKEDFGQTLAYWGVESGPYLMLPLLGPSTLRDAAGRFSVDAQLDAIDHLNPSSHRLPTRVLDVVDTRESLLAAERFLIGDRYTAVRNAYFDRRDYLINDGAAAGADDFLDE